MSRLMAAALQFPKWATHLPSERCSAPTVLAHLGFPFTEEARVIFYGNGLKDGILDSKVGCNNADCGDCICVGRDVSGDW